METTKKKKKIKIKSIFQLRKQNQEQKEQKEQKEQEEQEEQKEQEEQRCPTCLNYQPCRDFHLLCATYNQHIKLKMCAECRDNICPDDCVVSRPFCIERFISRSDDKRILSKLLLPMNPLSVPLPTNKDGSIDYCFESVKIRILLNCLPSGANLVGMRPFAYQVFQHIMSQYRYHKYRESGKMPFTLHKRDVHEENPIAHLGLLNICRYICQSKMVMRFCWGEPPLFPMEEWCWTDLINNPNALPILKAHSKSIPNYMTWDEEKQKEKDITWEEDLQSLKVRYNQGDIDHAALVEKLCAKPCRLHMEWLQEIVPDITQLPRTCWEKIGENPAALPILEKMKQHQIMQSAVAKNPNPAVLSRFFNMDHYNETHYMSNKKHDILQIYKSLCYYKNPAAIDILEANPDQIDWQFLSENPFATRLLLANPRRVHYDRLIRNPNPEVMPLLEANLNYMPRICWPDLFRNPAIFTDYVHPGFQPNNNW